MSRESDIQSAVLGVLKQCGVFHMRCNSGKVKMGAYWITLCPVGTADIVCYPTNRCPVWLEMKQAKGEQSEAQREFEQLVRQKGHGYFVVRSLDDVQPLLNELR